MKPRAISIKLNLNDKEAYFSVEKVFGNEDLSIIKREEIARVYYRKENKHNGATFTVLLMSRDVALKTAKEISKSLAKEFDIVEVGLV